MKTRVRAIIVDDKSILLTHRLKEGKEYYVFPGGGVEQGEDEEVALKREVEEELGVTVKIGERFALIPLNIEGKEPQEEIFYLCTITGGKLGTGNGPEFKPDTSYKGTYTIEWIILENLEKLTVLPEQVKQKILEEVKK